MPKYMQTHGCVNGDARMADSDWVTVKLPKQLAEQIDRAIKRKNMGYSSRAELIREAVRTYLATLKQP